MSDLDAFRGEIRAWLEENCPAEMREPARSDDDICWGGRKFQFKSEAQKLWMERCAAKGYTVPDWPKAYGGAGMSPEQAKIWRQEMNRINARPPLSSFGIWMLGPALLKFGTEEQHREFSAVTHVAPGKGSPPFLIRHINANPDTKLSRP